MLASQPASGDGSDEKQARKAKKKRSLEDVEERAKIQLESWRKPHTCIRTGREHNDSGTWRKRAEVDDTAAASFLAIAVIPHS